ncbi:dynactin subunit P25 [Scheffersomyces amazonensis]|uniref:dynactin subunit P25 n=1 Tax=Scheffersomyces amazonensis TaxID=1078765 RepID=UPI00315CE47F
MLSTAWIETVTSNRISKSAHITGSDRIIISGNSTIHPGVILRGDVELLPSQSNPTANPTTIMLGKYCYLKQDASITPPVIKRAEDKVWHGPVNIGAYTVIGTNSIIKSANIGNRVIIEDECVLNNLSIVYDCCIIRQGTIIPEKFVIPPYSEVKGTPGKDFTITNLNPGYKSLIELEAKQLQILGN